MLGNCEKEYKKHRTWAFCKNSLLVVLETRFALIKCSLASLYYRIETSMGLIWLVDFIALLYQVEVFWVVTPFSP